jgi:hypothetical protein
MEILNTIATIKAALITLRCEGESGKEGGGREGVIKVPHFKD